MLLTIVMFFSLGWQQFQGTGNGYNLKELRRLFYESEKSEKAGEEFYEKMQLYTGQEPVLMAYKGAAEAIEAKYTGNPISKLNHLKAAHKLFEQAVSKDESNPEIRFIRYSVESNTPKIVGMRDHLQSDKQLLIDHILRYPESELDTETYKIARSFLLADDDVSPEEKRKLETTPE